MTTTNHAAFDTAAMLQREARLMGRPIDRIVNMHTDVFRPDIGNGERGEETAVTTLIYTLAPVTIGGRAMVETRWAIYIDGAAASGGIV